MKTYLVLTAILGGLGVALGALGAHWLSSKVGPDQVEIWNTGVRYQMIHVVTLLILLLAAQSYSIKTTVLLFLFGIFFFSGSLYLLSLREVLDIQSWSKFLGPLTPLGGLLFILGWFHLAYQFYTN